MYPIRILSEEELMERYNHLSTRAKAPLYPDFYFCEENSPLDMRKTTYLKTIAIGSVQHLIDLQKTPGFRYLVLNCDALLFQNCDDVLFDGKNIN